MQELSASLRTAVLITLVSFAGVVVLLSSVQESGAENAMLRVSFFDVGQGDATYIESPDGVQVLVDGGPDAGVLRELGRVMGFFDRGIDMVVATHPDQDHIGGLVDVLNRYEVKTILITENESDTPVSKQFFDLVQKEGAEIIYARTGQVFDLGFSEMGSTTLSVLFPDRDPGGFESNASSIIVQLQYGDTEFMLTGDSPRSIEEYLVAVYGSALENDVLKAGHHGSKTSSASVFVETVDPEYAIISAGKGNRYGHPHQEVLDTFSAPGIEIKSTTEEGTVTFLSDGNKVWTE